MSILSALVVNYNRFDHNLELKNAVLVEWVGNLLNRKNFRIFRDNLRPGSCDITDFLTNYKLVIMWYIIALKKQKPKEKR